jgi:glutaredoxin
MRWRGRRGGCGFDHQIGDGGLGTGLTGELLFDSVDGLDVGTPGFGHESTVIHRGSDTCGVNRRVELLTREGCTICSGAATRLAELADELGFELTIIDVDAAAAAGDSALRAEFGDRLPVVLLDGAEHSYWEVDEPRLRADLARP